MASYRELRKYTFTVLNADNSQHVTFNDNSGKAPPQSVVTAKGSWPLWLAMRAYARRYGLHEFDVGYASRPTRAGEV